MQEDWPERIEIWWQHLEDGRMSSSAFMQCYTEVYYGCITREKGEIRKPLETQRSLQRQRVSTILEAGVRVLDQHRDAENFEQIKRYLKHMLSYAIRHAAREGLDELTRAFEPAQI